MKIVWQARWMMWLWLLLGATPVVWAQRYDVRDLEVEVINDRGRPFPQYPVRRGSGPTVYKAHLEAVRGSNYSIQIHNRTNQRIGVVIAVDGRNIISGDRSDLRPDERMYVLEPGQREVYEGWRTGRNRVNRFYFTDAGDSYADAWGDRSALGVIAVAAFREVVSYPPPSQPWSEGWDNKRPTDRQEAPPRMGRTPQSTQSVPGTGYGETEWSPSRRVEFEPERRPFARIFLKYAWRDTLCRERVIDCYRGGSQPPNRFWSDEDDYAPPPPPRERWR